MTARLRQTDDAAEAAGGPALVWSRTVRARWANALAMWHLLSLDAPTVAALWCWYIGRSAGAALPWSSVAAMFTAVWMLYAADRLLDSRELGRASRATAAAMLVEELEERHRFHHRHYQGFVKGIVAASIALTVLSLKMPLEALRLYVVLGTLLVAWFLLIHVLPRSAGSVTRRLPKELAVGVFFPAAVFIPTIARRPEMRMALLPAAALLSAVCLLNCLWIYRWEHPDPRVRGRQAHCTTRWATGHLRQLTQMVLAAAGGVALAALIWNSTELRLLGPIAAACASSAGIFLALDGMRRRVDAVVLRAAADVALLTPLLLVVGGLWAKR